MEANKANEAKTIQIRKLYIGETAKLIQKKGINGISMRKLSELSGLNVATMYSYFDNQNHLLTFAALKFLAPYTKALNEILKNASSNALERYIKVFTCFAHYSFADPEVFCHLFYGNYGEELHDIIREYYELYPEELDIQDETVNKMLFASRIIDRERHITRPIFEEGFITEESQNYLAEFAIAMHERLLRQLCSYKRSYTPEQQEKAYIESMLFLLRSIKLPGTPEVELLAHVPEYCWTHDKGAV